MVLQNNGVYTTNTAVGWKLWNSGIDGSATGQIVTMMDSGLTTKMEHFAQDTAEQRRRRARAPEGGRLRRVRRRRVRSRHAIAPTAATAPRRHSMRSGSISNMSAEPRHDAHAERSTGTTASPGAPRSTSRTSASATGSIAPPGRPGAFDRRLRSPRARYIQNHSWGAPINSYDASRRAISTRLSSLNPDFVVTVSAGNRGAAGTGTLGSPSTAKNAICVGGNDVANPDSIFIDCLWDGGGAVHHGRSRIQPRTGFGCRPHQARHHGLHLGDLWRSAANRWLSDIPSAMCQSDAVEDRLLGLRRLGQRRGHVVRRARRRRSRRAGA